MKSTTETTEQSEREELIRKMHSYAEWYGGTAGVLLREAAALLAEDKAGGEPDWRHPKIQALIGADARNRIVINLIWQLIEDPECELTASDMEYWDDIHDALKAKLTHPSRKSPPASPTCSSERCTNFSHYTPTQRVDISRKE